MNKAKEFNSDIEQKFEEALYNIRISNIEFIPYRSIESNVLENVDNLESSKLSASILIKKY
ncbi:hypothetical protein ACLIJS_07815 [Mammaliicoccus sciuri]|uniref:hypothetical protein n=1 Tax=Mammaliicoccus sciuri TaxID=1296 RepID=UPI003A913A52